MRVEAMVRELIRGCSSVVHAVRLMTVVKLVEAIIRGGRLSPATIGRSLRGSTSPKHEIKRVDRLLGNPRMTVDRLPLFLAIAHRLLRGAKRPVILVDWTQACGTHVALVAAVPIGGRALPIYVEVHPLKKLGNVAVERRFLRTLKTIVPPECRCVVVSDAGFKGPFFFDVLKCGWDFLGPRSRHDQGHLCHRQEDLEGRVLRQSNDHSHRPGSIRSLRGAADSLPSRTRSKATSTGPETPASSLQGRA